MIFLHPPYANAAGLKDVIERCRSFFAMLTKNDGEWIEIPEPASLQAKMKVGYQPDPGTVAGKFQSERHSPGVFSEVANTLSGKSVWISAVDGSYQSRLSYSVHGPGLKTSLSATVPTISSEGVAIDGAERTVDLVAGVLKRSLEKNPGIQEFRVKIPAPGVQFDYDNKAAHEFAVGLNQQIAKDGARVGGAMESLPEFQALRDMGFEADLQRSGLWHYQNGDVDHYYLVMTRPKP